MKYIIILSLLISFGCKRNQPNILFILVDDLGYADLSYIGTKDGVHTPNVDALKEESIVFPNAYTANPVCSPTRASIMTGKYPSTLKLTCHIPGVGMEKYIKAHSLGKPLMEAEFIDRLPLEELTIAEALKEGGYRTGFFGKWHLAGGGSIYSKNGTVDEGFHPDAQGFDVNIGGNAYGQPASYFSPYGSSVIKDGVKGEYLTDRLTDEAIKYMSEEKDEPFFCFMSYYSVHTPYQVPKELIQKNNGNKYLAMLNAMDNNVGRLLSYLKETGLDENTVVIFYSDNGGLQSNAPLKGRKGSLSEGGIRVPLLVKFPKYIEANTSNKTPVSSPDIFPTLLDIAGLDKDKYQNLEGESLYPILVGKKQILSDRALYWHFPHYRKNTPFSMACAIREGDWKLIYKFESKEVYLYNLKSDPYEQYNLSKTDRKITEQLLNKLKDWQKKTGAVMPKDNPDY